ncbi:MAG: histidine kinase [Fretibacterium sp.]|nr:histidine kinase [Fretibacterium sp.]
MLNWLDLVNFAIGVAGLTLSALGLILSLLIRNVEQWIKRFLVVFFAFLMGDVAGDLITTLSLSLLGGVQGNGAFLTQLGIFLESLFPSLLMPMLALFLLHCSNEKWEGSVLMYVAGALWSVYFILLVVTQFTTAIYYITSANIYHRGPWYPVLLVPPVLLMGTNLVAMYRRKDKLSVPQMKALRTILIVPLAAMLIQMRLYGIRFVVFGTTIAGFILFIYILTEQAERSLHQQIDIKVLQMRPHFIYNIMTSIYYLCSLDASKAQNAIDNFTTYLRKNFNAIVHHGLIPFNEELEHTRAYLAVEKARFEDLLYVEYDTPHTAFRLPPLTLQPIVENAVKHGVDPELSPLYVLIRTSRTEDGSRVSVEDTGPGFDPRDNHENEEAHIGLDNVRTRLKIMCGGTLDISPREGGGTVVTLWIPASVPPPEVCAC